ncbi:CD1375 family protein [Bacillus sp. JJ1562]
MKQDMLAMLFATYIMKGMKSYSDVPELLKPQVKQILEDEGLGHLAE